MRVQRRSILVHFWSIEEDFDARTGTLHVRSQFPRRRRRANTKREKPEKWDFFCLVLAFFLCLSASSCPRLHCGEYQKSPWFTWEKPFSTCQNLNCFPSQLFCLLTWAMMILSSRKKDSGWDAAPFSVPTPIRVLFYRVRTQPPSNLIKNDFIRGLTVVNWCINWQLPGSREEDEDLIVR